MFKLFGYEFKKNIFKISLLVLLLSLCIVNLYKHMETVRYYGTNGYTITMMGERPLGENMYNHFKGELTSEKINDMIAYQKKMEELIASGKYVQTETYDEFFSGYLYGDRNCIRMIIDEEVKYAYLYPNTMIELREKSDEYIDFYKDINPYEAKKGELIKNASYNRSIPVYGRYDAFSLFLDYEFSAFIIVILLIFVFSSTYSNEKATGTDRIIKSCGRAGSTFIAKQLTMLCFVVATVILFAIIDLIGLGFYYGLEFIEQPLYAIQDYQFTPLNISIGTAVVLSCLFKIFALAFIGEVIILISTLTKNTGAAIVLCFGVIGAMIFASPYIPEHLNPFTLISTKKLISDFEFVNVLGNPVPLYIAAPIIALLLTLILATVCYIRTSPAKRKAKEVKAV